MPRDRDIGLSRHLLAEVTGALTELSHLDQIWLCRRELPSCTRPCRPSPRKDIASSIPGSALRLGAPRLRRELTLCLFVIENLPSSRRAYAEPARNRIVSGHQQHLLHRCRPTARTVTRSKCTPTAPPKPARFLDVSGKARRATIEAKTLKPCPHRRVARAMKRISKVFPGETIAARWRPFSTMHQGGGHLPGCPVRRGWDGRSVG
jgi:hypothetical protein